MAFWAEMSRSPSVLIISFFINLVEVLSVELKIEFSRLFTTGALLSGFEAYFVKYSKQAV